MAWKLCFQQPLPSSETAQKQAWIFQQHHAPWSRLSSHQLPFQILAECQLSCTGAWLLYLRDAIGTVDEDKPNQEHGGSDGWEYLLGFTQNLNHWSHLHTCQYVSYKQSAPMPAQQRHRMVKILVGNVVLSLAKIQKRFPYMDIRDISWNHQFKQLASFWSVWENIRQGTRLSDDKIQAVAMAVDIIMWPKVPRLECASALQHIQKTCLPRLWCPLIWLSGIPCSCRNLTL